MPPSIDAAREQTFEGMIREVIKEEGAAIEPSRAAHRLNRRLVRHVREGDEQAAHIVEMRLHEGTRRSIIRSVKAERNTAHFANGHTISFPAYVAVQSAKRSRNGAGIYQHRLWYQVTVRELREVVEAGQRFFEFLGYKLAAFTDILALADGYPDSTPISEVCEAAGIDPKALEVNEQLAWP